MGAFCPQNPRVRFSRFYSPGTQPDRVSFVKRIMGAWGLFEGITRYDWELPLYQKIANAIFIFARSDIQVAKQASND